MSLLGRKTRLVTSLLVGILACAATAEAEAKSPILDEAPWAMARWQLYDGARDLAARTVEAALAAQHDVVGGDHPSNAPMLAILAGIELATNGETARATELFDRAVALDWHVALPPELASAQPHLDAARQRVAAPAAALMHAPPRISAGEQVLVGALISLEITEGMRVVLYHRALGTERRFVERELTRVKGSNYLAATLPALTHRNVGLQYYVLVYDAAGRPVASAGNRLAPLEVAVEPTVRARRMTRRGERVRNPTMEDNDHVARSQPASRPYTLLYPFPVEAPEAPATAAEPTTVAAAVPVPPPTAD